MSNSYKKAMDKIELSDELKKKIISDASKPKVKQMSKSRAISIKRIAGLAACFVLCILSYHIITINFNRVPADISKDNPEISETDSKVPPFAHGKANANDANNKMTVEQAEKELGYAIKTPAEAPDGYEMSDVSVVDGRSAAIEYKSDNDTIIYVTSSSSGPSRKNNTAYEFIEVVSVNNISVVLSGNKDLYFSAVWFDNGESFSITSSCGVEKSVLVDMVSDVS